MFTSKCVLKKFKILILFRAKPCRREIETGPCILSIFDRLLDESEVQILHVLSSACTIEHSCLGIGRPYILRGRHILTLQSAVKVNVLKFSKHFPNTGI